MELQPSVMVLVSMQKLCARLIRTGAAIALRKNRPLKVVHVTTSEPTQADRAMDGQVLNYLYALANEVNAEMCVLTAKVAVTAMVKYAQEYNVKQIVMGHGENAQGIAQTLSSFLPGVQIMIMDDNATESL